MSIEKELLFGYAVFLFGLMNLIAGTEGLYVNIFGGFQYSVTGFFSLMLSLTIFLFGLVTTVLGYNIVRKK